MSTKDTSTQVEAEWTILVYMAGDNNLDTYGGRDLEEMKTVGSTPEVNIIVQRDSAKEGTHRYHITKDGTLKSNEITYLGSLNSGDSEVLREFLDWGITTYPAKRVMAVLWNHGNGWDDTNYYELAKSRGIDPLPPASAAAHRSGPEAGFAVRRNLRIPRSRSPFFVSKEAYVTEELGGHVRGIAYDDTSQDFIDSVELKEVFNSLAKKHGIFEVIGMDACLMAMVENGVQIQYAGRYFVGSQETEPATGWPYDKILGALTAKPTMDGRALTQLIVEQYSALHEGTSEVVTQCALNLPLVGNVCKAADALGELLASALKNADDVAVEGAVARARRQSQKYNHPSGDYLDLWDFTTRLAALLPLTSEAVSGVQQAIAKCVFANKASHPDVSGSHGVSIYLPKDKVHELYSRLDCAHGGWARFLEAITEI
jgi:hypothetical protein